MDSQPCPEQKAALESLGFRIGKTNHPVQAVWIRDDIHLTVLAAKKVELTEWVGMIISIAKARGKNIKLAELRDALKGDPLGQVLPGQ